MTPRLPILLLLASLTMMGASGCADESPSASGVSTSGATSNATSSTGGGTTGGTTGGGTTGSTSSTGGCPGATCDGVCCDSGEVCTRSGCVSEDALCGFVDVCAEDEVCENDTCRPRCDGERCGADDGLCCEGDTICVFARCLVPGASCERDEDCALDELCETIRGVCVPVDADPGSCTFEPPVGDFDPVQEWQWMDGGGYEAFNQVMMMPAVANLTDDNGDGLVNADDTPDVVFTAFTGNRYNDAGILRIASGDDGRLHRELTVGARAGNCPALADIDGNGVPEILVERAPDAGQQAVMALDVDGRLLWDNPGASTGSGGVSVADLDGDGSPEVIARDRVIGADGETHCTFAIGSGVPISVDLDLDGTQEIFNGNAAFDYVQGGAPCPTRWTAEESGSPAVGNFDDDPEPELVTAGGGRVAVLNHFGSVLWAADIPINPARAMEEFGVTCGEPTCDGNADGYHKGCCAGGGPPTVADVDNDGAPEITIAARWFYLVYETDGTVRWAHSTRDFSSAATGSSVFDFEGDGRAEVVYNDEEVLRIYDGAGSEADTDGDGFGDAVILFEEPNPSGTLLEYPLIVDVDNDGNAEIVVAANNYAFEGTTGLRVFGDASDNWVRTRRIWNQHAYHVTHVTESGQVVSNEPFWWQSRATNSFRLNVQPGGLFNAPNLTVEDLTWNDDACDAQLTLTARIANVGSLGVREGVSVVFWRGEPGNGEVVCDLLTPEALPPGGRLDLSCVWELPEDAPRQGLRFSVTVDRPADGGDGAHNECVEDDNQLDRDGIACLPPG